MSKRILSLVLTLTLVLGSFSMAFADHADTSLTTEQKIEYLEKNGFIKGNESGDTMLDAEIDRASVATIIARTLLSGTDGNVEEEIAKSNYVGPFKDVPQSHWGNAAINVAVENQITNGTGKGEFSPARNITYIEVIAMMNRILGNEVEAGIDWNLAKSRNIALAREAGILDGINMNEFNYDDVAIRGVIFELLYNTVTNFEVGNYQIDKALVIENDRVISMDSNEIVVEVIEEVQKASFGNSERGKQHKLTLPKDEFDAEDLLGKVVDVSYDKTNKVVAVQVDNSYDYVSGPMELKEKNLKVDGKTFTVSKDEKYDKNDKYNDERIFNTYVNNEAFTYKNAFEAGKSLDFGKATIKNGKVIFIDAFAFDDIAPVKEVNKDGKEIVVYNDVNDGGDKKIELDKETIMSFENGSFHKIDKSEIVELNVIHVGEKENGDKIVVIREDAQVDGEYQEVIESKNKTVAVIDGEEYEILNAANKKPVYSYDSKEFRTLNIANAARTLEVFEKENVTILQDVNGNLQYIGSEIESGELVGIVNKVVGTEARVLKGDNNKENFKVTIDSKLEGQTSLLDFNNRLVYLSSDKLDIERITDLTSKLKSEKAVKIEADSRYVTQDGQTYRSINNRTNVFVRNATDNSVVATTLEQVKETIEKNSIADANVKARILTNKGYSEVNPRNAYNNSDSIINTIIFSGFDLGLDTNKEIVKVTKIHSLYRNIEVEFANGDKTTYSIDKDSPAYNRLKTQVVKVGDAIEIGIDKTDDKLVKEISLLTELYTSSQITAGEIESYDYLTKELKLKGDTKTYELMPDVVNLVGNLDPKVKVELFMNGAGLVEVITAYDGELNTEIVTDGTVTYINDLGGNNTDYVIINGTQFDVIGSAKEFFDNGTIVNNDAISFEKTATNKIYKITAIKPVAANKNVTLDASKGYQAFADLTVDGNLIINGASGTITATNVKVTGNLDVNGGANLTATHFDVTGATNVTSTGTVSFNSNLRGKVTVTSAATGTVTFTNVTFGDDVSIDTVVTIKNSTIAGDFDAKGKAVVLEGNVAVTGSLVDTGSVVTTNANQATKDAVNAQAAVDAAETQLNKIAIATGTNVGTVKLTPSTTTSVVGV